MNTHHLARLVVLFSGLLIAGSPAIAAPPVLTDLVVDPLTLEMGTGMQTVTISVQVFDPDGDLKNVKLTRRFKDDPKEKVSLLDDGEGTDLFENNGRFTGTITIDTSTAQRIALEVKAKDGAKNKAKVGTIVSVVDPTVAPMVVELEASPSVLQVATGMQQVTITATVTDPNMDLAKVKLELLQKPGQSKRAEDGKLGKLLDDGMGGDATAGDGVFTLQIEIDTAKAGTVPLRLKVKDAEKHKVDLELDLLIQPDGVVAAGITESFQYDTAGRLTNVIYGDGSSITYSYDNNGNILSVVNATSP